MDHEGLLDPEARAADKAAASAKAKVQMAKSKMSAVGMMAAMKPAALALQPPTPAGAGGGGGGGGGGLLGAVTAMSAEAALSPPPFQEQPPPPFQEGPPSAARGRTPPPTTEGIMQKGKKAKDRWYALQDLKGRGICLCKYIDEAVCSGSPHCEDGAVCVVGTRLGGPLSR